MYEIPILHPVVVHFPIAFLLLAGLTVLVWLVGGAPFWRQVTLLLLLFGFGGGIAAYVTGEAAEEFAEGDVRLRLFGQQHETMALLTLVAAGLALFVLVAYLRLLKRYPQPGARDWMLVRVVVAVLVVGAAVLVARTGHLGGLMVWGQQAGAPSNVPSTPTEVEEPGERE